MCFLFSLNWKFYPILLVWQRGGEVNTKDNAGQTALHWAAVRGSIAAADVLLQNGARVEAADINGYRVIEGIFCEGFSAHARELMFTC